MDAKALARRLSARDLVREYQAAIADIRMGFDYLKGARSRLDGAFRDDIGGIHMTNRFGRGVCLLPATAGNGTLKGSVAA